MTGIVEHHLAVGGRVVRATETHAGDAARTVVLWHHGTPGTGVPPEPVLDRSEALGLRWVSFDRSGYGGSDAAPGRSVADVARDALAVVDALGVDRFAVAGYSGGGTFALGTAALTGDRTIAVATLAALAPYAPPDPEWFAGMIPDGIAALGTAAAGREVRAALEAADPRYDLPFTEADNALFAGPWGWLGSVAGAASGVEGPVDDDAGYAQPWGVDPASITAPTRLAHGTGDRVVPVTHGRRLASLIPGARLHEVEGATHFTIVESLVPALEWVAEQVGAS